MQNKIGGYVCMYAICEERKPKEHRNIHQGWVRADEKMRGCKAIDKASWMAEG